MWWGYLTNSICLYKHIEFCENDYYIYKMLPILVLVTGHSPKKTHIPIPAAGIIYVVLI